MAKDQALLNQLLALSTQERAEIAQVLLNSLDTDQEATDCAQLWAKESEARLAAVKRGEIQRVSEAEVFAKYEQFSP